MGRLAAILVVVCLCGAASARAYDDFGAGIDANNRGDPGEAVVRFTRAIAAGDLPESYLPAALLGRARAELRNRNCAEAVKDLDAAIAKKPSFADAFALRAEASECLGADAQALADAGEAVRLRPAAGYLFTRSRLYFARGALSEARADAEAAALRDPGNIYFRLWAAAVAMSLNLPAPKNDGRPASTIGDWPGVLIDLYAGRTSPGAVWQAAGDNKGRTCEAAFYVGVWDQAGGRHNAAKALFARATADCPRDFVAFHAAQSALRRLE